MVRTLILTDRNVDLPATSRRHWKLTILPNRHQLRYYELTLSIPRIEIFGIQTMSSRFLTLPKSTRPGGEAKIRF